MNTILVRIGLVFGYSLSYYRDIVRGVRVFAESRPTWSFTPIAPEPEAIEAIRFLEHDGLIAHVFTRELADALARLGKPVVNVSGVLPDLPMPRVMADHEQVGRLAAEHFLERGIRHFGFVGYASHAFSKGREAGFRREAGRAGCRVESYLSDDLLDPEPTGLWRWDDELPRWLAELPRPAGVLASHDIQGVQLSEACRRAGLRVPDEVALVGVDDDDLLCEVARPSLSSVALPGERIGYEAAKMLEELLTGRRRRRSTPTVLLPSPGVVTRQSSDVVAIADENVAAAVRFIRANAQRPMRVADVLGALCVSRRSLERRFRSALGRGVAEEIRRVQVQKAKALLSGTEMPVAQVAMHAGFSETKQLSTVFRREAGVTPTEFRRRSRVH